MASAAQLVISQDGNCGASFSQTCLGSRFGDCCSGKGFCGSDVVYCGADCQSGFGTCTNGADSARISVNGNCGASDPENQICKGSTFGDSCSGKGFCGSGPDYAGEDCQPDFGVCDGTATSAPSPTTVVPGSSPTSEPSPPPASTTATEVAAAVTTTASSQNPTDTAITPESTTSPTSYSPSSSGTAISDSSSSSTALTGTQQPTPLSPGAKAGIAIAALAAAGILIFAIFFFLRRRRRTRSQQTQDQPPSSSSLEKPQRLNSSTTSSSPTNKPSLFNFPRSRTQTTTTTTSTVPPYGANSSVYEAYRSPPPADGNNDSKFAGAVELPLESDRRAEMRSGPATPGFFMGNMPPVEKEAGNLHAVVSELPSERWSGVERS